MGHLNLKTKIRFYIVIIEARQDFNTISVKNILTEKQQLNEDLTKID